MAAKKKKKPASKKPARKPATKPTKKSAKKPTKKSAKKPAKKSAKKTASPEKAKSIESICDAIESYFTTLAEAKPFDVYSEPLEPSDEDAIANAEEALGAPFPEDVRKFLSRGLRSYTGSLDDPFAAVGFSFMDANALVDHTKMLRDVAKDNDDGHAKVIRNGFAITYEEPEIVVSDDGVYHFSFRNPLLRVASSFTEFLEAWMASGCFASHDFDALWKVVKPYVKSDLAKNVWIAAYKKQFPDG